MQTQVAIIGAGPAGLLLSHVLYKHGIDAVILEARSRDYVEARIRAGVLEQCTVDLMHEIGVDERLNSIGLIHDGIAISLDGERKRIDLKTLSGGKSVTVYGQTQMVQDLVAARLAQNAPLYFEALDVSLHDVDTDKPQVEFTRDGKKQSLSCDFIAGCDGFYGVSRQTIPPEFLTIYERVYPGRETPAI